MLRVTTGKAFSVTKATERKAEKDVAYIERRADLEALSSRVLADLYNAFSGAGIKKFKTREDAVERTWGMVRIELKASEEPDPKTTGQRTALEAEIKVLKATLAEKTALLRSLGGGRRSGQETETVTTILGLLQRKEGATREQMVEGSGAKPGYVNALLSRILPAKGYTIEREAVDGVKGKVYRLG